MYEFSPILKPLVEPFIQYRKTSDRWNIVSEKNLYYFDRFCRSHYSECRELMQEMVDEWCRKRDTEINLSCYTRSCIIVSFIRYLRDRGLTNITEPEIPKKKRNVYIPHAFTQEELVNFFHECDLLIKDAKGEKQLARAIVVSVLFRLLYSSGIRTVEARLLRTVDVDLDHGILDIQKSKSHDQHYIVLHNSMLDVLRCYDEAIQRIYPDRTYFFPLNSDMPYYREWIPQIFRQIWDKVNASHAIPYDLRHNYATENINCWVGEGFEVNDKLLYLSKSMGHKKLESTKYYYSLVPALFQILKDKTETGFDAILPEVDYDEASE